MKENDWIIAGLNNPDKNAGDFRTLGLNMDNTQMLSKDEYLKSDYIKNNPVFLDESGKFSEKKFNDFYDSRLRDFQTFSSIEDGFLYDLFDYRRFTKKNANVKDPKLQMFLISNPQESTISNGWINRINESPLSDRERAEKNKVFDYETGQFLEYSPNEHSLVSNPIEWFKDIFKEPLVLATWDKKGVHTDPITGIQLKHTKGEKKLDNNGKYYYETLGGRSLAGKEVLSGFDTLTIDGQGLNNLDFFDSDDKEKSIGGTIMKNAVALAPLFIGGPIGTAYSAALVVRELLKATPMIDGLIGAVTGNDAPTAFSRLTNTLAGKATAATSSVSDYSKERQLTWENIGLLMADVALLWGQQKLISKSLSELSGSKKLIESAELNAYKQWKTLAPIETEIARQKGTTAEKIKEFIGTAENWKESGLGKTLLNNAQNGIANKLSQINRMGADAALMYMALVSNTDVYESMLEHGTTKREAMAVAMASMLGMYKVDKDLGLGEMFFNNLESEGLQSIRATLKNESSNWLSTIAKDITTGEKKSGQLILASYVGGFRKLHSDFWDKVRTHSLGAFGKAFGEGLEEVSEELVADASKLLYEWAAEFEPTNKLFGHLSTTNVGAFDNALDNPDWFGQMMARYGMNFLGGFLGGGIFYGKERFEGRNQKRDESEDSLIKNIRNYGASAVMKVLDEYYKQGKLGSTTLSPKFENSSNGKVYISATEGNSQNDVIYNLIKKEISGISAIINDDALILSDSELLKNMTLGDYRFSKLLNETDGDYSLNLRLQYGNLVDSYIAVQKDIERVMSEPVDSDKSDAAKKQALLDKLNIRKDTLQKQLEAFLSGEHAIDYMGQLLFQMDERVSKAFMIPNFKAWLENVKINKDGEYVINPMTILEFEQLDEILKQTLRDEYLKFKQDKTQTNDVEIAWKAFKNMRDELAPEFTNIQTKAKLFKEYLNKITEVLSKESSPFLKLKEPQTIIDSITEDNEDPMYRVNYDDYLEGESVEDYEARNTLLEGESEADFTTRREKRLEKLKLQKAIKTSEELQIQVLNEVADGIENSGGLLDATTRRLLMLMLGMRLKDIVDENIESTNIPNLSKALSGWIKDKLKTLEADLSNFDEVSGDITKNIVEERVNTLNDRLEDAKDRYLIVRDLILSYNPDYSEEGLTEAVDWNEILNLLKIEDQKHSVIRLNLIDLGLLIDGVINEDKLKLIIATVKNQASEIIKPIHIEFLSATELSLLIETLKTKYNWLENDLSYILKAQIPDNFNADLLLNIKSALVELNYTDALKVGIEFDLNEKNVITELLVNLGFELELIDAIILNIRFASRYKFDLSNLIYAISEIFNRDASGESTNDITSKLVGKNLDYAYYRQLLEKALDINDASNEFIDSLFTPDENGLVNWYNVDRAFNYVDNIQLLQVLGEDEDGIYFDEEKLKENESFKDYVDSLQERIANSFGTLYDTVTGHAVYNYISRINALLPVENPIINIIKKLGLYLLRDTKNVEALLEKLLKSLDVKGALNFTLTAEELNALLEAMDMLNMAEAYIFAAYDSTDILNPFPHNRLLMLIAKQHDIKIQDFPVIDAETADLYLNQVNRLKNEIGEELGGGKFNRGSWRFLDALNSVNKSLKFVNSEAANIKTKLTFFSTYRNALSCAEFDLLSGYEHITDSDLKTRLFKIELLFYENLQAIFSQHEDWTIKDVFDNLSIGSIFNNTAVYKELDTAELNEQTDLSKLTPMDKGIYLLTISGISANDFNVFLKQFTENNLNFAALDIQSHVSRTGLAMQRNHKLFCDGLEWMYSKLKSPKITLLYASFIAGNGGAGKTDVIIRLQIDFAKMLGAEDKHILLTGPTSAQEAKLRELGSGSILSIETILKDMLGDNYEDFVKKSESVVTKNANNEEVYTLKSSIKLKDLSYKLIIVDEATHLDTLTLSVLSLYARDYKVPLILVGDNYLQGALDKDSFPINLNSEISFLARTSRLSVTLRDGNLQKWNNIQLLITLLRLATTIPDDETRNILIAQTLNSVKDLQLHYYLDQELYGDLITDKIDSTLISKLKLTDIKNNKRKIAYLGDNLDNLKLLLDILGSDNVEHFTDETKIQGLEFSNIIIDKPFEVLDLNTNNVNETKLNNAIKTLKRIYTLSTRGINSAIFIDKTRNLQKIVNNILDNFTSTMTNFGTSAITKFNDSVKTFQESLNLKDIEIPKKVTTKSESEENPEEESSRKEPRYSLANEEFSHETENEETINGEFINPKLKKFNKILENYDVHLLAAKEESFIPEELYVEEDSLLIYGENSLSGMSFQEVPYRQDSKRLVREFYSGDNTDVVYDAAIFTAPNTTLRYEKSRRDNFDTLNAFDKLIALKKCFLYQVDPNGNNASEAYIDRFLEEYISEEDYINILNGKNIKLEIAEYNPSKDNYFDKKNLLSDSADYMSIAQTSDKEPKKLTFKLVAEFTILSGPRAGKIGRITLGMIANPARFENQRENIKRRLRRYLDYQEAKYANTWLETYNAKIKNNEEITSKDLEIYKTIKYLQSLESGETPRLIEKQLNRISEYVNLYENASRAKDFNGVLLIDLEGKGLLEYTTNTEIRTTVRNKNNTVPRLRLSKVTRGDVDVAGISFELANPDVNVSDVYIYRPPSAQADPTIGIKVGHPCVFVSRDPRIKGDNLIKAWAETRESKAHPVRMIFLDNMGCSVSDLISKSTKRMFASGDFAKSEDSIQYNKLPYENHRMAVRQIISLWNFRANLLQFEDALQEEINKGTFKGVTTIELLSSFINDTLIRLHELYREYKEYKAGKDLSESDFRNWCRKNATNLDLDLAEKIWTFNDSLANKCREFRLGIGNITPVNRENNQKNKRNRWQIRLLTNIENSDLYTDKQKEDSVYGIYLTPDYMQSLKASLDGVFKILDTLGLDVHKQSEGKWNKQNIKEVIITETGTNVSGKTSAIWENQSDAPISLVERTGKENDVIIKLKTFPVALIQLAGRAAAYERTYEKDGRLYLKHIKDGEEKEIPVNLKVLFRKRFYEYTKGEKGYIRDKENYTSLDVSQVVTQGDAFVEMLELCFHGTTDDFITAKMTATQHKVDSTGKRVTGTVIPLATDAYFKYGFFSDPFALNTKTENNHPLVNDFVKSSTSKALFTVLAKIDLPKCIFRFNPKKTTTTATLEEIISVVETNPVEELFNLVRTDDKGSNAQLITDILNNEFKTDPAYLELRNIIINKIGSDGFKALHWMNTVNGILSNYNNIKFTLSEADLTIKVEESILKANPIESINKELSNLYDLNELLNDRIDSEYLDEFYLLLENLYTEFDKDIELVDCISELEDRKSALDTYVEDHLDIISENLGIDEDSLISYLNNIIEQLSDDKLNCKV